MTRESDDSTASVDERLNTARLYLPETNCPWNARRISDHLRRFDGVVETSVVPRSDTLVVRYDPTRTSEAAITAAVETPRHKISQGSSRTRANHRSCACGCCGRTR